MTTKFFLFIQPEIERYLLSELMTKVKTMMLPFQKLKTSFYLFSDLGSFNAIQLVEYAQSLGLTTIACTKIERKMTSVQPNQKVTLSKVLNRLFFYKIMGSEDSYENYRKQILYIVHQTNAALLIWDQKDKEGLAYFNAMKKMWRGTKRSVLHLNPATLQLTKFTL